MLFHYSRDVADVSNIAASNAAQGSRRGAAGTRRIVFADAFWRVRSVAGHVECSGFWRGWGWRHQGHLGSAAGHRALLGARSRIGHRSGRQLPPPWRRRCAAGLAGVYDYPVMQVRWKGKWIAGRTA